jgi:Galactoside-binding lectin
MRLRSHYYSVASYPCVFIEKKTGKVLFPTCANVASWSPPLSATNPNEGAMILELADFDIAQAQIGHGNNTIAIKFTSPLDSKRFRYDANLCALLFERLLELFLFSQKKVTLDSINIAGPDPGDFFNVLFHFNPRQRERGGQVVINDKQQGIWGQGINIPLSQLPLMFGQVACTLVIQINGDGFDVFLQDVHCARLEHRTQLPSGKFSLYLQFPSTDDYGSPEVWTVYKVWWGNNTTIKASGDLSGIAGVNVFSTLHPVRTVFFFAKVNKKNSVCAL